MIQVFQTKFENKDGERSNSFAACLASLLETSLTELDERIKRIGREPDPTQSLVDFLYSSYGLLINDHNEHKPRGGYAIGMGKLMLGIKDTPHCCVFFDGVLVHNPHPLSDRLPLKFHSVSNWWTLEDDAQRGAHTDPLTHAERPQI